MLTLKTTTRFKKDYRRAKKRGRNMRLLQNILDQLIAGIPLDPKYRDHQLSSNYSDFRECHIQPDWLLIYKINEKELILTASRTGKHSDVFNE